MPRTQRPEFANRVCTNLSDAEVEQLARIADKDGAPVALVVRRLIREGLARESEESCEPARAVAAS